ncbi:flagellar biosynthetic protein FlhB [Breoghania corrubedonensis]|uniref:Flagellar biosynthetic protein FlhB n=1 Tax=Breoghania corrubedonensis TaxID=665038 RepID=A0A2T5V8U5_9HYPH|nr:flagellar biosynthesis protein FlhB [Breoghania corrubedonensis]PTW60176.1 flagellar biosynthetic protein FlhB [Breoghania corrubedonensis]
MSDSQDDDSKTEEPTEKKISDAIEKGNVPVSKEASVLVSFLAILLIGSFATVSGAQRLSQALARFIDDAEGMQLGNGADAIMLTRVVGLEVGRFLIPIVAILMVGGLAAAWFQNAPRVVAERIKPDLSRLSLSKGWKRIFGVEGLVEFLKALFKFTTIAVVALVLLRSDQNILVNAMFTDPSDLPETILRLAMRLLSGVAIATIILVAADLVWARTNWRRKLRMSRRDIKDEHKQMEGDPLVKARMRSLARDRARNRMMAAIPKATLVIANPTHFAVALRYERDEDAAPMVVAKGQDLIALKIRQIAEDNQIPVIENKELARALYPAVEIDRMIPPQFYRAVAEVIYYVYSRDNDMVV